MGSIVRLILGAFGINTIFGEDGTVDRISESPTSKVVYIAVLGVLLFAFINFIKDFKIFKWGTN